MTRTVSLLAALFFAASQTHAQVPAPHAEAQLRCDPGIQIVAVDGDSSRSDDNLNWDDCAIALAAGQHSIDVCYDVAALYSYSRGFNFPAQCGTPRRMTFETRAGRVYRVRTGLSGLLIAGWQPRIDDVTPMEARIPEKSPRVNKSRRGVSSKERRSILLMRIEPSTVSVGKLNGEAQGAFFQGSAFGEMYFRAKGADGFAMRKAEIGDTFAISMVSIDKSWSNLCDDARMPVFEDIPGGRVLYLGRFSFERTPSGVKFGFRQDGVEAAREYVARNLPEYRDKVEVASYRPLQPMNLCITGRTPMYNDVEANVGPTVTRVALMGEE